MQFNSFAEFLNMGGYAFYVWLSYGISTALIIYLIWASVNRHKAVLQQIAQRQKREQRLRQAAAINMEKQGLTQSELNEKIIADAVAKTTSGSVNENKEV